ncbi:MAG: hypothetical protein V2I63_03180 [Pseudomonadales bacterium]|nr:hypothetical protein [Pseudomonadales bacterium]
MIGFISPRRLEALKLDLEDRQNGLIQEIYVISRGLLNRVRVPEPFRRDMQRIDCAVPVSVESPQTQVLIADVEELHRVNRTLTRLQRTDFGRCTCCGEAITYDLLAEDPTRDCCTACEPVAATR